MGMRIEGCHHVLNYSPQHTESTSARGKRTRRECAHVRGCQPYANEPKYATKITTVQPATHHHLQKARVRERGRKWRRENVRVYVSDSRTHMDGKKNAQQRLPSSIQLLSPPAESTECAKKKKSTGRKCARVRGEREMMQQHRKCATGDRQS